ncbi:MAG: hypothetical protein ACYC43_10220 [Burkholderiales bacterium]
MTDKKGFPKSEGVSSELFSDETDVSEHLNDSAAHIARVRMRTAWVVLSAYIFMRIFMTARFEFIAYKYGVVDDGNEFMFFLFFSGPVYLSLFIVSLVAFVRLIFKRAFAPAFIYAFILGLYMESIMIHWVFNMHVPEMEIKGHIFAAYPNLCQTPIVPDQRISICYHYKLPTTAIGDEERLVFNPGDEMLLPPMRWPTDIKHNLGISTGQYVPALKIKRITGHFYWIQNDY